MKSRTKEPYDPRTVEARWRQRWAEEGTYRTPDPTPGERTYTCLDFFPYPSGAGLSVGHGRNYVPSDVVARYHRMRGEAVLHPMGWDAFGLPAENEALLRGVHPADSTARYAANYRRQLDLLGCSYDWDREIASSDPAYYRWNQAFFLMLYRRGLAYRAAAPVNWCDSCQTVLADEEIEGGCCWRCHRPIERRTRSQWYIRVTEYAEELTSSLESLDWPEHILTMQRNWIGRQPGVEIDLGVVGRNAQRVTVFTTRADTLFGVTFVALAPEHPLASQIASSDCRREVEAYIAQAAHRSDVERHSRQPDGVATGAAAVLPDGTQVPIYVADYVLADVGTGAVMGVPAHDVRDFALAQHLGLPVKRVVEPATGGQTPLPFTEPGVTVASGPFSGMTTAAAQEAVAGWLETSGLGRAVVRYRLRDWLVSRQRYWGTPIPIVHCPRCGEVPVAEASLPVVLPPMPDYQPRGDGRSPLANVADFVHTTCPACGSPADRETDTLTGFVCSSWYYLRFADPHNDQAPFSREQVRRWMPVDVYIGGAEHAVSHLLYSRFWTKVLADEGWVDFREPFPRLRSQGVLHARDRTTGAIERMSKSKGNIVTPESVIERYGADATRLHLLFMGPFEANTVWEVEPDGKTPLHIEGVRRFLQRVWQLGAVMHGTGRHSSGSEAEQALIRAMHRTVRDVTNAIEVMHFNTAISALMAMVGLLEAHQRRYGATEAFREARATLLRLLAPFAPFVTEELWGRLDGGRGRGSIHHAPWPTWDVVWADEALVTLVVQVNGRTRGRIEVARELDEEAIRDRALSEARVREAIGSARVRRVVVVRDRLVNIVAD